MSFRSTLGLAALFFVGFATLVSAHCQVPCGIYDDAARVNAIKEDIVTIEKASRNIRELSGKHDAQSMNQMVRWINTKEAHASHIIQVVSEYFLTQKLKPGDDQTAYYRKLADHHALMRAAMKAKQSTDQDSVHALREAAVLFARHWVEPEKEEHSHGGAHD
jgi:nickel superoxide dismutase